MNEKRLQINIFLTLIVMIVVITISVLITYKMEKDENEKIDKEKQHLNFTVEPLSVENIANGQTNRHVKRGFGRGQYKVPDTTIQLIYTIKGKDKLMNIRSNNVTEKFDSHLKKPKASIQIKDHFSLAGLRSEEIVNDYYNNYDVTITYPSHHWKDKHHYKGDYDKIFVVNKPKKSEYNDNFVDDNE